MMMLNPNQSAVEQYCQENNVRVAPSSIWKLQYLEQQPVQQKAEESNILNFSLYKFDSISI